MILRTDENSETIALDDARQLKAREYARIRRRLLVFNIGLAVAYLVAWLTTGAASWWRDRVQESVASPWLVVALFAAGFGVGYAVMDAFSTYYGDFILPHRYGVSHQSFRSWLWDQAKGSAISGLLGLFVLEVIYWLLRVSPDLWWFWTFCVVAFFSVVLSSLAPVLIFPLFYKFVPLADEDLCVRLLRLSRKGRGPCARRVYL